MWCMVRWPRTCGYQPVMKLHLLGVHTGFWQNARENDTPSSATSRSIAGVTAASIAHVPEHVPPPLIRIEDDEVGQVACRPSIVA